MTAAALALPNDFDRILALPQREPLDCERERGSGGTTLRRWVPAAQALIDVVTERFTRGQRLSCACRDRSVHAFSNGGLRIFHKGRADQPPPPPVITTIDEFARDNAHDPETVKKVAGLRAGQNVWLPGLGYPVCATEFNPVQAWTLRELPRAGGILAFISVGGGKTFLGIETPLAMPHVKTWAILIKPDQRIHYRKAYIRLREHFRVPSIVFDQTDLQGSYLVPGAPVLHVLPYSILSNPKSTQLLEKIDPDGLIADEAHKVAGDSAMSLRYCRFVGGRIEHGRPVVCCNWSGSLIKRSMKNVWRLSAFALGFGSPYPIVEAEADRWSDVIDPSPRPDRFSETAKKLSFAFGRGDIERSFAAAVMSDSSIRTGHRDRVMKTLGVISTRSSSVTCSISILERKAPPLPESVKEALAGVRNEAVRPDGEELGDAMEIAFATQTIAAGYYHCWVFPTHTDEERAEGGLIDEWFKRRKAFNKELRAKTKNGEPHLDSRKLCEEAAKRAWQAERYTGPLPVWPAETWPAWAEIEDKVRYEKRVRWIDDFLARDAAAWAQENRGIVWCTSTTFGRRVAELAGINYHGGGPNAESKILAEDGKKSIVASIKAHGEGRDGLQFKFSEQLIGDVPPASGDRYEQFLGRLAREGQAADTVTLRLYRHVPELRDAFEQAKTLAEFIEAYTPNRQLLLAADVGWE